MFRKQHHWILSVHIILYGIPSHDGEAGSPGLQASECQGVQGATDRFGTPIASGVVFAETCAEDFEVPFVATGEKTSYLF